MKKSQFDPLVISTFETKKYPLPLHSHTYYEIVYIFKGCGNHHINNIILPYTTGDLFLLSPDDAHFFDIKKLTKFCFIKFTDNYFLENKQLSPDMFVNTSPIEIMKNSIFKEVKLNFTEPCKTILRKTVENIDDYNCRKDVSNSPIVFFQVLALFGLIQEAASKLNFRIDSSSLEKEDLLTYIHQNIYYPEKNRIEIIANHFNISKNYFSTYFKRTFNQSYRSYVNDYRIKLIEKRIQSGQMNIKQIAYEFNFTDESHLSNYFKKQRNVNPSNYREVLNVKNR